MKAFVPTINYKFVCLPINASSCRVLNMKFAPIFNPDKIPANIAINNTQQSRPKQQSCLIFRPKHIRYNKLPTNLNVVLKLLEIVITLLKKIDSCRVQILR